LYSIAPEMAIPSAIPTLRIAVSVPEAMPRWYPGTLPMTVLLFGLWKSPVPTPKMARRQTTSVVSEEAFKLLNRKSAVAQTAMPQTAMPQKARPLAPHPVGEHSAQRCHK